jgi:hypothetical protein
MSGAQCVIRTLSISCLSDEAVVLKVRSMNRRDEYENGNETALNIANVKLTKRGNRNRNRNRNALYKISL